MMLEALEDVSTAKRKMTGENGPKNQQSLSYPTEGI
jgi:hypothetical protein